MEESLDMKGLKLQQVGMEIDESKNCTNLVQTWNFLLFLGLFHYRQDMMKKN